MSDRRGTLKQAITNIVDHQDILSRNLNEESLRTDASASTLAEFLIHQDEYIKIANKCDEVIGEIKVITEEDFKKVQRPIEGYTLHDYISNMASFNKQYNGKFIFEITIVKGYNDDPESVNKLKEVIKTISPNKTIVARIDDDVFKKKLGISDERFEEISRELLDVSC